MNYGKIGDQYRTKVGALCSIFVAIISLVYFSMNMLAVQGRKGTNVMTSIITDYFDESVTFGSIDGFAIAFSIFNWQDPFNDIDYSLYYDVYAVKWVTSPTGYYSETVGTHKCTPEEFEGIITGSDQFYPLR